MASLYKDKKSGKWCVSWMEPNKKRKLRKFATRDIAQKKKILVESRVDSLKNGIDFVDAIAFVDAMKLFKEEHLSALSQTYQVTEKNRLEQLKPYFKEVKLLTDLKPKDLAKFRKTREEEGVSSKTIINEFSLLSSLYEWAKIQDPPYCENNPLQNVEWPDNAPRKKRKPYTRQDLESILANACSCHSLAFALSASCGLRRAEMGQITKEDFDFIEGILWLKHTEATPVKGKEDRFVVVPRPLLDQIATLPVGKILQGSLHTFWQHFKDTLKRAAVREGDLHELRHTFVSLLANDPSIPPEIGMKYTGHKEYSTYKKYITLRKEDILRVRNLPSFVPPTHENDFQKVIAIRCTEDAKSTSFVQDSVQNPQFESVINQPLESFQRVMNTSPTGFEPFVNSCNALKNKEKKIKESK